MDQEIIITSAERLREILKEVFTDFQPSMLQPVRELPDTMSLATTLDYLNGIGYPTSKSRIYQLTSAGKIPHRKYGSKLVFLRSEIDQWTQSQTHQKEDTRNESLTAIAESARRKLTPRPARQSSKK